MVKNLNWGYLVDGLLFSGYNNDVLSSGWEICEDGLVAGFDGDDEFQETVRKRLVGSMVNNGNRQKVVSMSDVEMFLGRGWSFVAKLSDEKAILKIS